MFWYNNLCVPIDLGDGKMNSRKLAKFKNNLAFQTTFSRLLEDSMDLRYDIEGEPDTVDDRVIKQSLLWHANVVFFERQGSLMALPGAPTGGATVYGRPASSWVYSANGIFSECVKLYIHGSDKDAFLQETVDSALSSKYKGVMVWENRTGLPFVYTVMNYAEIISDTMRTLDVIRENVKNPNVFVCEESVVPTVKKYLSDRESNMASVISSGVFDPAKVQMIPFDSKGTSIKDVTSLIEWYENKFRELCGVDNNSQIDKKGENLVEAEVSVNNDYTECSVEKCIGIIEEGLDDVNKVFGTHMKVRRREKNEDLRTDDGSGADNVAGRDAGSSKADDK